MRYAFQRGQLFAVLLLYAGCGELTALEIALVPNTNVSDPARIIDRLQLVEVVVDSEEGLYPGRQPAWLGDLELVDVDDDWALELRARLEVGPIDHLPRIGLEQGGLPDEGLDLVVTGRDADDGVLAYGEASGVVFAAGERREQQWCSTCYQRSCRRGWPRSHPWGAALPGRG